jgi:glutamyl-Q tRNA(Asp) synthetase
MIRPVHGLPDPPWRTRFAPAPTGFLHLGHAVNALFVWGLARAFGGRVVLRVEDHDRTRSRPEYEAALLDDLDWLGLAPDEGTTAAFRAGPTPLRQSDDGDRYAAAVDRLGAAGLVYACTCTRKQIQARTGRRRGELWYPGICRDRRVDPAATPIRRLRLERREIVFTDLRLGECRQVPSEQCGDLLLRDRDGHWTYQLAVVVDDHEQGIDVVIRGEDLLASTGRQIQLAELLGRREPPRFLHHPLVLTPAGRKLSKSAGDTGIRELREEGWTAARVLGEAARRGGLLAAGRGAPPELAADDLGALFRERYGAA